MFIRMLEFALILGFIWFILFQMVIPYVAVRPMFPMFRRKHELEKEMAIALEEADEGALEKKITDIRNPPSE